MTTVSDILKILEEKAPPSLAAEFDNPGFLVGKSSREVKKVLVALDVTSTVIDEAKREGAELIVSHHPVIFTGQKSVTDRSVTGGILLQLIESGISVISMHTNLDFAKGGVNDILASLFGIEDPHSVEPIGDEGEGGGRYGTLASPMELSEFLQLVCKKLSSGGMRYHDASKPVRCVAVGGGSCGDYITTAARLGCDTIVTADIKHNQFLDAQELSINAIDAGHFATENIVCPYICKIIEENFADVSVSIAKSNTDATRYFFADERKI